jgi:hypothetical protein
MGKQEELLYWRVFGAGISGIPKFWNSSEDFPLRLWTRVEHCSLRDFVLNPFRSEWCPMTGIGILRIMFWSGSEPEKDSEVCKTVFRTIFCPKLLSNLQRSIENKYFQNIFSEISYEILLKSFWTFRAKFGFRWAARTFASAVSSRNRTSTSATKAKRSTHESRKRFI